MRYSLHAHVCTLTSCCLGSCCVLLQRALHAAQEEAAAATAAAAEAHAQADALRGALEANTVADVTLIAESSELV